MAAYCRGGLKVICEMTAYTPGSAPDPTLGNEHGRTLRSFMSIPYYFQASTYIDYENAVLYKALCSLDSECDRLVRAYSTAPGIFPRGSLNARHCLRYTVSFPMLTFLRSSIRMHSA